MDSRRLNYILFFVLSFLIIFVYTTFFAPKPPSQPPPREKADQAQVSPRVEPLMETPEAVEESEALPTTQGRLITIKTALYEGIIDTAGGRIVEWRLERYKESTVPDSPPVNLLQDLPPSFNMNLYLKDLDIPNPIPFTFEGNDEIHIDEGIKEITLDWKSPEGVEVRRTFEINASSYLLKQTIEVVNKTRSSLAETLFIESFGEIKENGGNYNNDNFIAMVSNSVEKVDELPQEKTLFKGPVNWFGFSDKYFLAALLPGIGDETQISLFKIENAELAKTVYAYPPDNIPPGSTSIYKSNLYLGPMDYEILRSVGLEGSIKYGWVGFLAKPLLWFLKAIDKVFQNYGVSIIVITVIIRLIFLPLTIKSMASMKEMQLKMQELKPKMDALKEKYKDDKTKQNAELMKLYTSHGINPLSSLGGCLPLLIQIPVFIALYDVLLYSIELRHSSFLWINDLSEPEHLFDIPGVGIPFRILPLAMGASWYLTQKMTPMTAAPGADNIMLQTKIMEFMPLIFTVMFWGLPSGLILYWTVSNILSIVQQVYVNRRFIAAGKGGTKDADSDRKGRKDRV